jgi:hypothetical protein
MSKLNEFETLFCSFFHKQETKTPHETLANYSDNSLIPGGDNGTFYTHINYYTMKQALIELIKQNKDNNIFVETGCSAHGTKSTLLWDKIVNLIGGKVISVDLNSNAVNITNENTSPKTTVYCSDSLKFLPSLTDSIDCIDFLYLDSYDVDFLNPLLSAEHHLKEFNCVKHLLRKGSIILIDDTPCSPEWLDNGKYCPIYSDFKNKFNPNISGKGAFVNKELAKLGATKIMHQYQTLWIM